VRETRAKQVLFEEIFPDAAANNMKRGNSQFDYSIATSRQGSESSVIFERTMTRKANKVYSAYIKQIESLFSAIEARKGRYLIRGNALVSSVLLGFVEAQDTIRINLEIRLVFMKLFEQHFLMNSEKLFLDSISILNNIDNKQFIDRLYSSSSSFHMLIASSCTPNEVTQHNSATAIRQLKLDSKAVESSVTDVL
jgi:hypothetical protein